AVAGESGVRSCTGGVSNGGDGTGCPGSSGSTVGGGAPSAVAALWTTPASTSAWVTVHSAVAVADSPGASTPDAPGQSSYRRNSPGSGSSMLISAGVGKTEYLGFPVEACRPRLLCCATMRGQRLLELLDRRLLRSRTVQVLVASQTT